MKKEITLTGKWEFIGAESFIDTAWHSSPNFVAGMAWEFHPQYFSASKTLGSITESTPTERAIDMAYIYNEADKLLMVGIFTDSVVGAECEVEADIYSVIDSESTPDTIRLSLLAEPTSPPPYFRYILQRVGE